MAAAAEAAMAARLDSLEETVLTLAEPLLRPTHRTPDQGRGEDKSWRVPRPRDIAGGPLRTKNSYQPPRREIIPGRQPGSRAQRPSAVPAGAAEAGYSHSIVPGGLLVTSSTTRLICGTSLVIRVEMCARTSSGSRAQSAVIASSLVTGRSTTGCP